MQYPAVVGGSIWEAESTAIERENLIGSLRIAMRCALEAQGRDLPLAGDAQWSVSLARWLKHGRSEAGADDLRGAGGKARMACTAARCRAEASGRSAEGMEADG